jgi:hypothetical protein
MNSVVENYSVSLLFQLTIKGNPSRGSIPSCLTKLFSFRFLLSCWSSFLCITDLKQLTEDVFSVYGYIRYEHKLEIIYLIIYRAGTINGSILAYCVLHQKD